MHSKSIMQALAILIIAANPAFADVKRLYVGHTGETGSLFEASVNEFARRANEKLPPEFRVVAAGASILGSESSVLEKVGKGEVAFGLPSTVMSSVSPKFGVFELPFLIRDREQVRKISDALLEPVLQPEVRQKGLRILAVWENGFRQITNNLRPIRSPADLAGLKLRVPVGEWRIKCFKALGASPMPIAFDKTFEALREGKAEGQENPLAQIHGGRFDEVQRYLTLSDHVYTPAYLITSEEQFAKLPPGIRYILGATARDLRSWIFAKAVQMENSLLDEMSQKMVTNQIDVVAFREASRPLYREFIHAVPDGANLILTVAEMAQVPASDVAK